MNQIELQAFSDDHLNLHQTWAENINSAQYMSRIYPKAYQGKSTQLKNCCWYVIVIRTQIIGTIWLEKISEESRSAILGIMIGEPDFLGQNIGRKAIELAITQSKKALGISEVRLNVRKNNLRAIKCYEKCQFQIREENQKTLATGEQIAFYTMVRQLIQL